MKTLSLWKPQHKHTMNRNNRKLVRQLESLKIQIDKLKEDYLSRISTPPAKKPSPKDSRLPTGPAAGDSEMERKNRQLIETALQAGEQNTLYKTVTKMLDALQRSGKKNFTLNDLDEIRKAMDNIRAKTDHWEIFRQQFSSVYPGFFDNLKTAYPNLTKTEVRFCAYLRIHLNSQQIASAMDISREAIRKNRYRIRKKMELKIEDSLEDTIEKF